MSKSSTLVTVYSIENIWYWFIPVNKFVIHICFTSRVREKTSKSCLIIKLDSRLKHEILHFQLRTWSAKWMWASDPQRRKNSLSSSTPMRVAVLTTRSSWKLCSQMITGGFTCEPRQPPWLFRRVPTFQVREWVLEHLNESGSELEVWWCSIAVPISCAKALWCGWSGESRCGIFANNTLSSSLAS